MYYKTLLYLIFTSSSKIFSSCFQPINFTTSRPTLQSSMAKTKFTSNQIKILPTCSRNPYSLLNMNSNGSPSSSSSSSCDVLFQKVIRPPKSYSTDDKLHLFLPSIVSYIQDHFQIPNDLTIPYQSSTDVTDDYSVLTIDSPLSQNPSMSLMHIEIVGIYPDGSKSQSNEDKNNKSFTLPTMAMVVVKTPIHSSDNKNMRGDLLRQGLFQDSKQKIIKALDRGLDDFVEGRIKVSNQTRNNRAPQKDQSNKIDESKNEWNIDDFEDIDKVDEEIFSEFISQSKQNSFDNEHINNLKKIKNSSSSSQSSSSTLKIERDGLGGVIIDTIPSTVTDVPKSQNTNKHVVGSEINNERNTKNTIDDYAINAAKAAMAKRKQTTDKTRTKIDVTNDDGDFAVNAAKKAAAKASRKTNSENAKVKDKDDSDNQKRNKKNPQKINEDSPLSSSNVVQGTPISLDAFSSSSNPSSPRLRPRDKPGQFRISISNPNSNTNTFTEQSQTIPLEAVIKRENTPKLKQNTETNKTKETSPERNINLTTDTSINTEFKNEKERQKSFNDIQMKSMKQATSSVQSNTTKSVTKTYEEIEQDVMKAALDLMPDSSSGLSPEELLKDVLKFGEEQDKNEKEGTGFASGVFSKTKELIGLEQNQNDLKFKEISSLEGEIKVNSVEEELKKIFAAGESIAESRSSLSRTSSRNDPSLAKNSKKSFVTDDYVDELIDSDNTVPRNARSLDDELAELEVRISRSPDEDLDKGVNALFDVFSGPEVYNPNVDPLTAVNWPGAPLGSRTDVKLPPELSSALKNSEYAARILSKIIEVSDDVNQDENDLNQKKSTKYFLNGQEISIQQIAKMKQCVDEGVAIGLIKDPIVYLEEKARLQMLIDELSMQPEERFEEIASNYKDLLLSDNLITLLRDKWSSIVTKKKDTKSSGTYLTERHILTQLISYAQLLLKEVRALGAELENSQLEVIRSICMVAMDPKYTTEEETATALTDAVRDMRPLLDENFVAYLKYAVAEEEGKLARSGVLDDPEHNRWLFVLKIVQEGVYTELARGIQRYIDHIWYVLRMKTKAERKMLLKQLIDVMPSMDIRPFVKVVDNIAASLGSGVKGDFDTSVLGGMTNKILQLRRDVHDLLPPEIISIKSKDADEWAAKRKKMLLEQRNMTRQRLKASRETESIDTELDYGVGEVERMT